MNLTSSRFAAAIGLNPHCSRQRLFRQLTGAENVPFVSAMQWGIDHEKDAVAGVEAALGILFDYTGRWQKHFTMNGHGYQLGTTPDGVRERLEKFRLAPKRVGLEVKCPQKMYDEERGFPLYHVPQLIGQAKIAKLEEIYFSAWTPGEQRIWIFKYNESLWEWMEPLLGGFIDNWEAGTEPPRQKKPVLPEIAVEELTCKNWDERIKIYGGIENKGEARHVVAEE